MRKLMKSKFLIIVSFFAVSFFVFAEQMVYIYKKDGTKVPYVAATLDSIGFVNATSGNENGHEWVDLGLPSGTKWATCNVGATTPEGYGDYFYWGDTSPISNKYSSYLDSPTTLPLERDAAYVNWGSSWRMPTIDELYELRDYTTFISTTQNGVVGYYITSKTNGNSIFLPLTGKCFYRSTSELDYVNRGDYGCYWSSSFSQDSPVFLFCKTGFQVSLNTRHIGYTVRPVLRE